MKIDARLNLVIPVEQGKNIIYVHSIPIGRVVFERFYMVMSKTFARIYSEGLGLIGGPKVSALLLKDTAHSMGDQEEEAIRVGLLGEIRRLSNVVMLGPNGWESVPLEEVFQKKLMDEDDISDVENALVFFTVASWMLPKMARKETLTEAGQLWGAQTSLLNCTEYAASLKTSTEIALSVEKATPSSVVY